MLVYRRDNGDPANGKLVLRQGRKGDCDCCCREGGTRLIAATGAAREMGNVVCGRDGGSLAAKGGSGGCGRGGRYVRQWVFAAGVGMLECM